MSAAADLPKWGNRLRRSAQRIGGKAGHTAKTDVKSVASELGTAAALAMMNR